MIILPSYDDGNDDDDDDDDDDGDDDGAFDDGRRKCKETILNTAELWSALRDVHPTIVDHPIILQSLINLPSLIILPLTFLKTTDAGGEKLCRASKMPQLPRVEPLASSASHGSGLTTPSTPALASRETRAYHRPTRKCPCTPLSPRPTETRRFLPLVL